VIDLASRLDLEVGQLWIDGRGDIAGESPRGSGPDEKIFARPAAEREADKDGPMGDGLIALVHLHLADADAAARAPGHGIEAAIDQAALVTFLEKGPYRVVVFIRHREVALALVRRLLPVFFTIPVHPLTEPLGLLGLSACEVIHACLAKRYEAVD